MVKLRVEDASVLEADDHEDDISEPEEDSLAGQMALMKGQKVKPAAEWMKSRTTKAPPTTTFRMTTTTTTTRIPTRIPTDILSPLTSTHV